jgi:transposase
MGRRPKHLPALTISAIEDLKRQGYKQSEIAAMYDVSRQAITWHKYEYNGSLTPREEANRLFPWKVPHHMNVATQYRRLRDHGEFMATGGRGMSESKLKRLKSWYRKLREENLVVEFDPDIPPAPGVAAQGGFAYRRRKASDGDMLIRINKHLKPELDLDEVIALWQFPPGEQP